MAIQKEPKRIVQNGCFFKIRSAKRKEKIRNLIYREHLCIKMIDHAIQEKTLGKLESRIFYD